MPECTFSLSTNSSFRAEMCTFLFWLEHWVWNRCILGFVNKVSFFPILYDHFVGIESLRWRHNDHAGVSNHQPHGCLLNRLFGRKSKNTSKLRVTGLCAGNSLGTGFHLMTSSCTPYDCPRASQSNSKDLGTYHIIILITGIITEAKPNTPNSCIFREPQCYCFCEEMTKARLSSRSLLVLR